MVKLLDCTLRDGGYVNNWNFTDEQVTECYKACSEGGIEYMEIGFRNRKSASALQKYGATYFCTDEFVNKIVADVPNGSKVAVMVTINEFDFADFVPASESNIKLVRVLMAYHGGKNGDDEVLDLKQLNEGILQINKLTDLGYEVAFNIGRIDKVSFSQLYEVCKLVSSTRIKYFVMADTYGSVELDYIETLIPFVKNTFRELESNIEVGFHAHDNCANATSKALYSLKFGASIIDGCMLGFGRGSGNAKTELLTMNLNKHKNRNYNIVPLLSYGDIYISSYKECNHHGSYNLVYAIAAYIGCHISYAIDIIEKYDKLDIVDVYNAFLHIKAQNKHMFYNDKLFNNTIVDITSK
jgi:4-hydroxy 2-oxovalerate aldolase